MTFYSTGDVEILDVSAELPGLKYIPGKFHWKVNSSQENKIAVTLSLCLFCPQLLNKLKKVRFYIPFKNFARLI